MNAFHPPKVISDEMVREGKDKGWQGEPAECRRWAEGEDRSVLSASGDTRSAKVEEKVAERRWSLNPPPWNENGNVDAEIGVSWSRSTFLPLCPSLSGQVKRPRAPSRTGASRVDLSAPISARSCARTTDAYQARATLEPSTIKDLGTFREKTSRCILSTFPYDTKSRKLT